MEDKFMRGTPPMCMLPAKNYVFKITDDYHVIEIPRTGKYVDLAPEFFTEEDGEFNVLDAEGNIYMPSITKILFATKKYPDLNFNQFFIPTLIKFTEDTVTVVGQIADMMLAVNEDGTVKEEE